jgi:mannose-1-phosphate guanylyltransferase
MSESKGNKPYVAIMAGGIGSRFWPASRAARPKQFLDILGVGKSLIRLTFERFLKLTSADRIYVVTNAQYRDLVKEHLPELSDDQIIGEPSRNNTAPCIAYTAFKLNQLDPESNMVVAPSDHIILKEDFFVAQLQKALAFTASNDALVTLGIQPTRPDTGYGYINFDRAENDGIHQVKRFTEKPKLEKAQEFLDSGDYLWNAGIFVWSTQAILKAFSQYATEIHELLGSDLDAYNSDRESSYIQEVYPKTPSISVDYAIMENADNIFTLPSDLGWSDLGTWASLHAESEKDENRNVVQSDLSLLQEVKNSLIRLPEGKLAVIRGLDDFIVVDEEDVLLIFPKSQEQEIKPITAQLKERFGDRFA